MEIAAGLTLLTFWQHCITRVEDNPASAQVFFDQTHAESTSHDRHPREGS